MELTSENIYIRFYEKTDAQALFELRLRNAEFFQKYAPTFNEENYTLDAVLKYIRNAPKQRKEDKQYAFGIFLKDENKLIGEVSLSHISRGSLQRGLIGYSLDKQYNGKGYTTEAVCLAVRFAFDELKMHRIEAGVMLSNIGSMRVLEKAGFQREGIEKKGVKINGRWEDHQIFAKISDKD